MNEPIRWREAGSDAPAELRRLFEAGTTHLPSEGELRELAARLGPMHLLPAAESPLPSWRTIGKVAALGVAVAGAAVAFALNFGPGGKRPPDEPETVTPPLDTTPSAQPSVAPSASGAGDVHGLAPTGSSAATSSASASSGAAPARSSETEPELLERARGALATNPARALALTEQHRARFPAGVLAQEREVIAVQALKRLGRTDEAARRAAEFARRYPNSAYRKKLDADSP